MSPSPDERDRTAKGVAPADPRREGRGTTPARVDAAAPESWAKRVGWFVLLWVAGVLVVGVVAYAIRLALLG